MFEAIFILTLFVTALALAVAVGLLLSTIAKNRIPKAHPKRRAIISLGFALPILTALYLLFCAFIAFPAFIPNETEFMFGDIQEPLPNGYTLRAMGKMSDWGSIAPPRGRPIPAIGTVARISLNGTLVLGQSGHPVNNQDSDAALDYFALDTANGHMQKFSTLAELAAYAGHPINLVPNNQFHSPIHRSQRLAATALEWLLALAPPAALTALHFRQLRAAYSPANRTPQFNSN